MKFKFRLKWLAFWRYFRKSSSDLDIWADPSMLCIIEHMSARDHSGIQFMFKRWKSLGAPSNQERRELSLIVGRDQFLQGIYFGVYDVPWRVILPFPFTHQSARNAVQLCTSELNVQVMQWLVTTFPNVQSLEIELTNQSSLGPADQVASMMKHWKLVQLKVIVDDGQALTRLIEPINELTELKYLAQLQVFFFKTQDNIGVIIDSLQNLANGNQLTNLKVRNPIDDDHLSQVLQLDSLAACHFQQMCIAAPNQLTSDALYNLSDLFSNLRWLHIYPLPSSVSLFQLTNCLASLRNLDYLKVELKIKSLDCLKLSDNPMDTSYAFTPLTTIKSTELTIKTTRHYKMNEKYLQWIFPNALFIVYVSEGCDICGLLAVDEPAIDNCALFHNCPGLHNCAGTLYCQTNLH